MPETEGRKAARELSEFGAHLNAAQIEFALQAVRAERSFDWGDAVVRSFAHYLSISTGVSLRTGAELFRVGRALEELPAIREAGLRGELSFDKVRLVTGVAPAEDDRLWAGIARELSCSQLARFCRQYRLAREAEDPGHGRAQMARRAVWSNHEDDGMLRLVARLMPEDGAKVLAVIDALVGRRLPVEDVDAPDRDPAEDRWAAARADALVAVFEHADGAEALMSSRAKPQVVVHVDEAVLEGRRSDGRCELEDAVPIDAGTAARLACDGELITVVERNGSPLDVGRTQYRLPPRLRRAVTARDKRCRYPGCVRPPGRSEVHHLDHWGRDQGRTDLGRLIVLCKFHHVRHHQGAFQIEHRADGRVEFLTPAGEPIRASEPHSIDPSSGGAPFLRRRHEARGLKVDEFAATSPGVSGFDPAFGVETMLTNRRLERDGPRPPRADAAPALEVEPDPPPPAPDDDDAPIDFGPIEGCADQPPRDPTSDPHAAAVLRHMELARRAHTDQLVHHLGFPVGEVLAALTQLELAGKVDRVAGGYALAAAR